MRGFSSDLPDYWYAHHAVNRVQPGRAAPLALAASSLKSLSSIYIQEVAFRLLIPTLSLKIVNFTATFRMLLGVATLTDLQITRVVLGFCISSPLFSQATLHYIDRTGSTLLVATLPRTDRVSIMPESTQIKRKSSWYQLKLSSLCKLTKLVTGVVYIHILYDFSGIL